MKIRVLVVDDSSFMRKRLTEIINTDPDLEVVGAAEDADSAWEMAYNLRPHVMTLDVQMPKTSGLELLERLMRERPMRVVMVSAFTREGSESTLKALELGAIDFIGKPRAESPQSLSDYTRELTGKIHAAHGARLFFRHLPPSVPSPEDKRIAPEAPQRHPFEAPFQKTPVTRPLEPNGKIIFLGASTGGTEAVKRFLTGMPEDCPPILIVQHMPETFTPSFAAMLDARVRPHVLEAQGGEVVHPGTVYIAPGHSHMIVRHEGAKLVTELTQTPPVNYSRPSVDVLFDSAISMGKHAIGVILTGMGRDGAQGLLRMRKAGARTFGQNKASCVVYGMPREAFLAGGVEEEVGIDQMAGSVLALVGKNAL